MRKGLLFICYLLLFSTSCVDTYNVPGIGSNVGFLVVEGFINSGSGPTSITLSRTIVLESEATKTPRELKAQVSVEGSDLSSFPLTEQGSGVYRHAHIPINANKKYRVRIKTSNAKEYLSEFVEVKQTPPIDSVTWEIEYEKRGIQFYAYTHDPNNAARYYHWDYDETWQYQAPYVTILEYKNGKVVYQNPIRHTQYCWMTNYSKSIYIASTTRLSNDVVYRYPLQFIPSNSESLQTAYHSLVKQYALTRDEYDYLTELKKNTEQRGSIFDSQPSQLHGNMTCITNTEYVLGYVGAHGMQEKSVLIISGGSLPAWFDGAMYFECEPGEVNVPPFYILNAALASGGWVPQGYYTDSYKYLPATCVDCRLRGGTNIKPDYWP